MIPWPTTGCPDCGRQAHGACIGQVAQAIGRMTTKAAPLLLDLLRAEEARARLALLTALPWPPALTLRSVVPVVPRVRARGRQAGSPSWARRKPLDRPDMVL